MSKDVVKRLEYWAFKLCGKGEQEDAASDVMREALREVVDLRAAVEKLTRELDEARAEVERLREALVLASEALASHQGSPGREWHNAGAWLYPGDSINVVRAPLPEIKVEP